jgi:hypothetical protein
MTDLTFDGFEIRRRDDGYIHASDMCKVGGKVWKDYYRQKNAKAFIDKLKSEVKEQLIFSTRGGRKGEQGTWIHPRIAIHLAQWISADFAVKVSGWIMEWSKYDEKNSNILSDSFNNLKPDDPRDNQEKKIQDILHSQLKGRIEVQCEGGFIDLLTDTQIIEIKNAINWKDALGQILVYSGDYPDHEKVLYLFNHLDADKSVIEKYCVKYDITVKYF